VHPARQIDCRFTLPEDGHGRTGRDLHLPFLCNTMATNRGNILAREQDKWPIPFRLRDVSDRPAPREALRRGKGNPRTRSPHRWRTVSKTVSPSSPPKRIVDPRRLGWKMAVHNAAADRDDGAPLPFVVRHRWFPLPGVPQIGTSAMRRYPDAAALQAAEPLLFVDLFRFGILCRIGRRWGATRTFGATPPPEPRVGRGLQRRASSSSGGLGPRQGRSAAPARIGPALGVRA
jgi:hypothetical protein